MNTLSRASIANHLATEINMQDSKALRGAFSRFATGISVLTTCDESGEMHGVTVNSLTSLSLDPALILWALGDATYALDAFINADSYVLNILSSQQQQVSDNFALEGEIDRFENISYTLNEQGIALIDGCLARFHCCKYKLDRAGDHWLFLGEINRVEQSQGEPLIYYNSSYRQLETE